ncbi:MAG: hypothetical protein H6734_24635 [Alphaproteobacteria bacterium]|nr:hypothetical protein [Alphaproteobacteria bacterium]
MTVTTASLLALVAAAAVGAGVLWSRSRPEDEPEVPPRDEDTEEVEDELTEADSLIAGQETADWATQVVEAAALAGRTGDLGAFEAVRIRFEAIVPCPDDDLAHLLVNAAGFLRELAIDAERTRPRHALELLGAAVLLEPERVEMHGSRALVALTCLDEPVAREAASRARDLDPDTPVVGYVDMVFCDANVGVQLPRAEGEARIVRDVADVRRILGIYHARIAGRRRRLVAAGAPTTAPWLPSPPSSWAGEPAPDPLGASPLDDLKCLQAEWTGARVLCDAVGWADLQPRDALEPASDLGERIAGVEAALWHVRDRVTTGGAISAAFTETDPSWRGHDLGRVHPVLARELSREIAEVQAALTWLVRDDVDTPFDQGLRDS